MVRALLLAIVALMGGTGFAQAAIIGFNSLGDNDGWTFTSYDEAGFHVTAVTGEPSKLLRFGNPAPSLLFFFLDASLSGSVAVSYGGLPFTFESVDLFSGSLEASEYNDYLISGFYGSTQVFTQSGSISEGLNKANLTISSVRPGAIIDRLLITESEGSGSNGAGLDNIVVQPATDVPEPASLALLGMGVAGFAALRRRR